MDMQLDKKAIKKLAEEKLRLQLRRDLLYREDAMTKINNQKMKEKWYDILLNFKIPEMQDNLRHILFYMEKLIEDDTFRKALFEEERQEFQEQLVLQSQSHTSALDVLYGIYKNRVQDMQNAFVEAALEKKNMANEEFKALEIRENLTKEMLQSMIFQMKVNEEKKIDTMNCNIFLKFDDETSKYTEEKESLSQTLERKMEKRWSEITTAITNYEEKTEKRKNHYLQLKAKDDADSKLIYQQMKKTQKMFDQVEELKKVCEGASFPADKFLVIEDLKEEKKKLADNFREKKSFHLQEIQIDKEKLQCLTVASNESIQALKEICAKGEKILTLFRVCLKLETEEEKIIPVAHFGDTEYKPNLANKNDLKFLVSSSAQRDMGKQFGILNSFWLKAGRVHLSRMAIQHCIIKLKKQNKVLKQALMEYLRTFSAQKSKK